MSLPLNSIMDLAHISTRMVVEKAVVARTFWGAPLHATFPTKVGPENFTTPSQPLYPEFSKRTPPIVHRAVNVKAAATK